MKAGIQSAREMNDMLIAENNRLAATIRTKDETIANLIAAWNALRQEFYEVTGRDPAEDTAGAT